jgi:acyl-CoA dehydrogenase
MLGAMERCLELSVKYAQARQQFGRPIGRFQAVQHMISDLASSVHLARAMVSSAIELVGTSEQAQASAAAKICAGMSALNVLRMSHQVHGAIGFTAEYELQRLTRRLMAWRDDYGTETYWSRKLGRQIIDNGAHGLFDLVSTRP